MLRGETSCCAIILPPACLTSSIPRSGPAAVPYGGPPTSLLAGRSLSLASLAASLDGGRRRALEAVLQLSRDTGLPVYLVGGPVRDALLGAAVLDLDFSVEGDAVELARRIVERMGGRLTTHSRFGTATVVSDGTRIDLVTARRETYSKPGQLPRITPGSIADDLARRDFSINAMALPLSPEDGRLIDPLGGLDDLNAGIVRTPHLRSFVDDPTRMLRAVRYEQRFGFHMEGSTLMQMTAAVADGHMDAVSGDRWRHELERILDEAYPGHPLLRAAELGLLAGIHPSLGKASAREAAALRKMAVPPGESPQADDWLAALFAPLTASEAENVIQRLRLSGRKATLVRDTIAVRESEPKIRAASGRPSELAGILAALEPAAVSAYAKLTGDPVVSAALRRYADEWRYVRPRLSGETLLEMGATQGPEVGEIMSRLLTARLDGEAATEDDEMALARELLARSKANLTK